MTGLESMQKGPERLLNEAVKVKPRWQWGPRILEMLGSWDMQRRATGIG